jgi:serine/threonine protein phosphatase PrpC
MIGQRVGLTDPGRRRRRNEDAYICEPPLFAVADGMGGAQAGELASRLAAAALQETGGNGAEGAENRVISLIQEANRRVYERSSEDRAASGMGTTITVALVDDGVVTIGHVGDSRAYLIREGSLDQLTEDHSLVAELVRSGELSPEEAEVHPQRSVITRVLGTDPDVDVDTFSIEAREGDIFLLCSDGLTTMVDDETILGVVERHRSDLGRAARELVKAANRGGGEDNITIVFFEISSNDIEQTARLPAPVEPDESDQEADTLDELDRVPAVDTMVVPPERAHEVIAPREERRRSFGRRFLYGVLALLVIAAALVLILWGVSRAHFVGAEHDGYVAVYQGLPYDVADGVRLYRAVYVSPLRAALLTQEERRRLFDHDLRSYDSALAAVRAFERATVP